MHRPADDLVALPSFREASLVPKPAAPQHDPHPARPTPRYPSPARFLKLHLIFLQPCQRLAHSAQPAAPAPMLSWDRRAGFIPRGVLAPPKPKKTTNATKSDKNRNFRTCLIRVHPRPSAAKITKRTQPRPPLYRTPNHIPLHKRPRLPNSHPLRKNAHCSQQCTIRPVNY